MDISISDLTAKINELVDVNEFENAHRIKVNYLRNVPAMYPPNSGQDSIRKALKSLGFFFDDDESITITTSPSELKTQDFALHNFRWKVVTRLTCRDGTDIFVQPSMYKSSIEKIAPTKRSKKFLRFYIVRKEGEGANNELNENEIESMIG